MKCRADQLCVTLRLADSRTAAQRLIADGKIILPDGSPVDKPGRLLDPDTALAATAALPYVSRGAGKLLAALEAFPHDLRDAVALDVGASTGGFTDCLLQHGARRVLALDVGTNQIHYRLRTDPRVWSKEQFNCRYLTPADLPEQPTFAVTDVSFISLKLILPPMAACLAPGSQMISLIKPQFEAGRKEVPHGVVRSDEVRERVVQEIRAFGTGELGLTWLGCERSPLLGPEGNVEFLAWWRVRD